MQNELDIGVSIPVRNSDFMDLIMDSGIDDNGVARDSYFEHSTDNPDTHKDKMTDDEFTEFLNECGIGAEQFYQW